MVRVEFGEGVCVMRWVLIIGIAIAAVAAVEAGSARSQEADEAATPVEVAAPIYAYGPQIEDPPKIRPRYNGRYYQQRQTYPRFDNRRYGEQGRYRGYAGRGETYNGNGYRDYRHNSDPRYRPNSRQGYGDRAYGRSAPSYRYRFQRPQRLAERDQYSARVITPQLRGQWRDLGPIYQLRSY